MAFTTESVKETVTTVQALKNAKKDLSKQMKAKEFNIDKIDQLQDDMVDLMDRQKEIQEALGTSYDVPDVDESELMEELDALDYEMATDRTAAEAGGVPSYLQPEPERALPVAPTGETYAPMAPQQQQQGESRADRSDRWIGMCFSCRGATNAVGYLRSAGCASKTLEDDVWCQALFSTSGALCLNVFMCVLSPVRILQ